MLAFSVRGSASKDTGSWPGCIILHKRSEHSQSFVSAGGPGTNLPHILGATIGVKEQDVLSKHTEQKPRKEFASKERDRNSFLVYLKSS